MIVLRAVAGFECFRFAICVKCYKPTVMDWTLLCADNKSEERSIAPMTSRQGHKDALYGLVQVPLVKLQHPASHMRHARLHAHDVVANKSEEGLRRSLSSRPCHALCFAMCVF